MTALPVTTAALEPDGQSFEICSVARGVIWRGRYPVSELPRQLRFYRGLRDRQGGAFARFHQPAVDALETLQASLRARPMGSPSNGSAVATAASAATTEGRDGCSVS